MKLATLLFATLILSIELIASAYAAEITLAWDANTEPDLAGYKIYYGTDSRDYGEPIDVGDVTKVTLVGFETGKTYYFAATAYDEDDNESAYSEELVNTFDNGTKPNPPMGFRLK